MSVTSEPAIQQQQVETTKVAETSPLPQDEVAGTAIAEQGSSESNANDDQPCAQEEQKPHLDGEQEKKRFNLFKKPKNFGLFGRTKATTTEEIYISKEAVPTELPQIEQMDPIQVDHNNEQQTGDRKSAAAAAAETLEPSARETEINEADHEREVNENKSPKRISFLSRLLLKKKAPETPSKDEGAANVAVTTTDTEQVLTVTATEQAADFETVATPEAIEEEETGIKEKKSPSSPTFGRRLTAIFGKKSAKKASEKEEPTADEEEANNGKTETTDDDQGEPTTTAEAEQEETPEQEVKKDEHEPTKEEDEKVAVASASNKDVIASS